MTTRTTLNFWIDLVSLIALLGLMLTGGLMYYVLPPGTGHSYVLWGLGRHDYGQLHGYLAVAAVLLLAAHLVLHWGWICCVVATLLGRSKPTLRAQRVWGISILTTGAVGLFGGLWAVSGMIEPVEVPERHHAHRASISAFGKPSAVRGRLGSQQPVRQAQTPGSGGIKPAIGHHKHEETCPAGVAVNGRTTLRNAAVAARLDFDELGARLGLPSRLDPDQRLGRLKRRYGLAIHEVRRVVCEGSK